MLALAGILTGLIQFAIGLWFKSQPRMSGEAVQAARAAAAETNLGTEEKANAEVAQALAAGVAADRIADRDPGSLRAPDPNSRD